MATTRGSIAVPRFPSSSYLSCKPKSTCTLSMFDFLYLARDLTQIKRKSPLACMNLGKYVYLYFLYSFYPTSVEHRLRWVSCMYAQKQMVSSKLVSSPHWSIACSAVQESSTPTATAETTEDKKEAESDEQAAAPVKPKPPAKAPAKPLPKMMGEDVIPSLKAILEAQDDISQIDLSFGDNRLEGSLLKKGVTYSFWAFFPNGVLTGPKGFSLSSYGSEVSTVEPFLIDERRISAKHVVFWVEKRLAAQGIIPVWKQ